MSGTSVGLMLKTSAGLWLIWGLVHTFAGVMTIVGDTATAVRGIADGVDPALLQMAYPQAVDAIVNQHGFNLFWFGVVTIVCAWFIWNRSTPAIFIAALVGGLADVGYFMFLDLGGHVNFVPGTVMTIFSASAIILSLAANFMEKKNTA